MTMRGTLAMVAATVMTLAACSPLGTLNAVIPASSYTLTADVAYGLLPRQRLDIYRPTEAAPAKGWPVVVFFYGGSWNRGEKADYKFVGEALASRGARDDARQREREGDGPKTLDRRRAQILGGLQ